MAADPTLRVTIRRCTALLLLILTMLTMAYLRFLVVQGFDSRIEFVPIAFGLTALVFVAAVGYLLLSVGLVVMASPEGDGSGTA